LPVATEALASSALIHLRPGSNGWTGIFAGNDLARSFRSSSHPGWGHIPFFNPSTFNKEHDMGLSIRAYAQHRGVSHTAVAKAIKAGRIPQEPDGSVDPAKADAAWDRNTIARGDADSGDARSGVPNLQTSRAIREAYAARLAKLDFEERTGKTDQCRSGQGRDLQPRTAPA